MGRIRMLATDLDGTFIGDPEATEALWRDLDDAGIVVVFSTGRHLRAIADFYIESGTDRRAAACVTMVGTEIWIRRDGTYHRDEEWDLLISEDWDRAGVEAAVAASPSLVLQAAEWQSPFKCSYYLEDDVPAVLDEIDARLTSRGLRAKVVHSSDRYLDLLPIRSGKGEAVRHLAGLLGVAREDVVTAGDTANDLDMMRPELGFRAISVGNAHPELLAAADPGVYRALAPHAAGIREGLEHFGWLTPG